MSHETAKSLTMELREATGQGTVEWAEANAEYVIWPQGEPCRSPNEVRQAIQRMIAEDRFSKDRED